MIRVVSSSQLPRLSRRSIAVAALALVPIALLRRDGEALQGLGSAEDRSTAELLRAAERSGTCTAANAVGVGLRGEYFADESWRGEPQLVRVDGVVDFDHALDWSGGNGPRPRSVRWSGWIKAPLTGPYRFHADSPNMRILVARQLFAGVGASADVKMEMSAGRFYPIVIEVSPLQVSETRIRLEWTAPHGARYLVQRPLLHLPTDSVTVPGNS